MQQFQVLPRGAREVRQEARPDARTGILSIELHTFACWGRAYVFYPQMELLSLVRTKLS